MQVLGLQGVTGIGLTNRRAGVVRAGGLAGVNPRLGVAQPNGIALVVLPQLVARERAELAARRQRLMHRDAENLAIGPGIVEHALRHVARLTDTAAPSKGDVAPDV